MPNSVLSAGGTLSLRPLTLGRRLWLPVEMALIYLGVPFLVERAVHGFHVPVFIALLPVLAIILVLLLVDPTFSLKRELSRGFSLLTLVSILAVFAHRRRRRRLLGRARPSRLVPRIPAQPPRHLLDHHAALSADVGAGAGARLPHVLFPSLRCPVRGRVVGRDPAQCVRCSASGTSSSAPSWRCCGTFVTGLLFALRYALTRSFWAVYLEHTLWGALVFTVGLGRFFFTGVGIVGWR